MVKYHPSLRISSSSASHSVVLGLISSASPGDLSEIKILELNSQHTKSETLRMGLNNLCFNKPFRWFWSTLKFSPLLILSMILGKSSSSFLGLNFFTSKLEDWTRFYVRAFLTLTFWFYKIEHCLNRPTRWQSQYYNLSNTHHSKAHIAEEVNRAGFFRSHCPQWKHGFL